MHIENLTSSLQQSQAVIGLISCDMFHHHHHITEIFRVA